MIELSEEEADMLAEVGNIGAGHASNALSQLIGHSVEISVPSVKVISLEEIPERTDLGDELVIGLYIPVSGDVEGGVLLIIPRRDATKIADMMMGRELGSTTKLDEMDESSLKELGNILVGNSLTALSAFLGMDLEEHVPQIAEGPGISIIDSIAVEFMENKDEEIEIDQVLRIKENMKIEIEGEVDIATDFFMLFSAEDAREFMNALRNKVG